MHAIAWVWCSIEAWLLPPTERAFAAARSAERVEALVADSLGDGGAPCAHVKRAMEVHAKQLARLLEQALRQRLVAAHPLATATGTGQSSREPTAAGRGTSAQEPDRAGGHTERCATSL